MAKINWPHCVGQKRVKGALEAAVVNDSLGHAYLFSGMEGCGKFAAALDLSLMLLCENRESRPCLNCGSCRKVLHYAHPDFHVIMPVVLQEGDKKENELSEAGWKHVSDEVLVRIKNAYSIPEHEKIPSIPVDWVREINQSIQRGTVEGGANIVIIDGADSLNKDSANSMLKLLEEPPAGTLLLLLTARPSAVLPTIVSRCQMLRFSWVLPEEIRAALCTSFGATMTDPRIESVVNTGSLGQAAVLWNNPSDGVRKDADMLWNLCLNKDWTGIADCVDRFNESGDFSFYEQLFEEILLRVRKAYFHELGWNGKLFSGDGHRSPEGPACRLRHGAAARILDLCERTISSVKARANMTLVLADFAITLTETLNGEKQQPR